MVYSHTEAEIKGTERDCTRPDDAPVKNTTEQQFTPDQIDECCLKVENLGEYSKGNAKQLIQCVQIIRQLQEELACLNLQK